MQNCLTMAPWYPLCTGVPRINHAGIECGRHVSNSQEIRHAPRQTTERTGKQEARASQMLAPKSPMKISTERQRLADDKTGTARGDVYLVRHGETAWSLTGQHTGLTDLELTPHGEEQARTLCPRFKNLKVDHLL